MTYYQEITLIPDADTSPYFLWGKVMSQLHIALADAKNKHGIDSIGISFPNYRYEKKDNKTFASLGDKLRVFAPSQHELETLALPMWLSRLIDYVHLTTIKAVGDKATGYVVVQRYRQKGLHFYAKNHAKYHNVSYDDALKACQHYKLHAPNYPFVAIDSKSNKHKFRLSIRQTLVDSPKTGAFNSYGINNQTETVTVPHW